MKRFNFACVLAAFLVMSGCARAACIMTEAGVSSYNPLVYTLPSFTTEVFDPNVPNGTILSSNSTSLSTWGGKITCPWSLGWIVFRGTTAILSGNIGGGYVYSTGISGVGMRFKYSGTGQRGWWPISQDKSWMSETTIAPTANLDVELIKTGPITAGGVVTGEVGGWFAENGATQVVSIRINGGIVVQPQVPTCRVTTPAITVPLGSMPASTFTGVGSVSPSKPFNIALQCSGGETGAVTNVYTTLTDHTNPGNVSDTLSLASDATATGIGIQVLNGSTVIKYGPDSSAAGNTNQWKAGTTGNGTFTIPLTARYIQTAPKVTPGTADGLATFTMSYQ
ncbi:fimbrial protein [Burkholderia stagnalis]|uniref:fimbrial protein n=1 Tax=Burkholderia stagnalis TaxID=1503054 RepID=UPI000ADFA780|nr:fimbrial protein [Burkholderia stagnalis]